MEYLKPVLAVGYALLSIILGYVFSFFAPIFPFLAMVMVLVFSDLITGIQAAKKEGTYVKLKASNGLRNTVSKISQYFIAILLSQGMVLAFDIPTSFLPLTYIVAFYISLVELKSNFENIARSTGTDVWQVIQEKLDGFFTGKNKGAAKAESSTDEELKK